MFVQESELNVDCWRNYCWLSLSIINNEMWKGCQNLQLNVIFWQKFCLTFAAWIRTNFWFCGIVAEIAVFFQKMSKQIMNCVEFMLHFLKECFLPCRPSLAQNHSQCQIHGQNAPLHGHLLKIHVLWIDRNMSLCHFVFHSDIWKYFIIFNLI